MPIIHRLREPPARQQLQRVREARGDDELAGGDSLGEDARVTCSRGS